MEPSAISGMLKPHRDALTLRLSRCAFWKETYLMQGASPAELLLLTVLMLFFLAIVAYPAGRICSRLGFSPWLGLLALVPVANVLLLFYVAFSRWPSCPQANQ